MKDLKNSTFVLYFLLLFMSCTSNPKLPESHEGLEYSRELLYGSLLPLCENSYHKMDFIRIAFVAKYDTNFCYFATKKLIGNPPGRFEYILTREQTFKQRAESQTVLADNFTNDEISNLWHLLWSISRKAPSWGDTLRYELGVYDYVVLEYANKDSALNTRIIDVLPDEYLKFKEMRIMLDSLLKERVAMEL